MATSETPDARARGASRSAARPERRALPSALREGREGVFPSHFVSEQNLLIAFGFHCNLACTFCMVEDSLGVEEGVSLEAFRALARDAEATRDVRRVMLSGGEATLEKDLFQYVEVARSIAGVEHVRLQTNATKLASPRFAQRLAEAGVDEFFVSLHGATAETCDRITQVDGSFKAIMNGVAQIAASDGRLYTNTCIVTHNYEELPALVELVAPFGPRGMDFWGLWPRLDREDQRALCAPVGDVRPHLVAALEACEAKDIAPVVKWFPRCLLGEHARYQNDAQPTVLIQQSYWEDQPEFMCLYEGICAYGRDNPCAGLSDAYVTRHGWEERLLEPAVRRAPDAPAPSAITPSTSATGGLDGWLVEVGLAAGQRYGAHRLDGADPAEHGVRLHLGGDFAFTVYVYARALGRPAFLETPSFSLVHSRVAPESGPEVERCMRALGAAIEAVDGGALRVATLS